MYDKDKMGAAVLEGVIATIDDGLKDAGMLCEWACDAKHSEMHGQAEMFHEEAEHRIDGARQWWDKHKEMLHDPKNAEMVAAAFLKRLEDKLAHMKAKSAAYK